MNPNTSDNLFFFLTVTGLFAIGAFLVVQDHPWFALLVFICGSAVRFSQKSG